MGALIRVVYNVLAEALGKKTGSDMKDIDVHADIDLSAVAGMDNFPVWAYRLVGLVSVLQITNRVAEGVILCICRIHH